MLYEDRYGRLWSLEAVESLGVEEIEDLGIHVYLFLNALKN